MTVQTELLLEKTYRGFKVIDHSTKQTLFSKNTVGRDIELMLKDAIARNDETAIEYIATGLFSAAMDGGWGNAPGGYLMKHNGYMFGTGLRARNGTVADLTLTIRTDGPII